MIVIRDFPMLEKEKKREKKIGKVISLKLIAKIYEYYLNREKLNSS